LSKTFAIKGTTRFISIGISMITSHTHQAS
jgi:hypothetical protein